jgi:hypothetical protein
MHNGLPPIRVLALATISPVRYSAISAPMRLALESRHAFRVAGEDFRQHQREPNALGSRNRLRAIVWNVRNTPVANLAFGEHGLVSSTSGPHSHAHSARDLPPTQPLLPKFHDLVPSDNHPRPANLLASLPRPRLPCADRLRLVFRGSSIDRKRPADTVLIRAETGC